MCCYRPIVLHYGLWDQIRVDFGREFSLMLSIQQRLAHLRHDCCKEAYVQSPPNKVSKDRFSVILSAL